MVAADDEPSAIFDPACETDDFLIREGFDLIAAFRAIRSETARKAVLAMIAAVAQAERDASSITSEPAELSAKKIVK